MNSRNKLTLSVLLLATVIASSPVLAQNSELAEPTAPESTTELITTESSASQETENSEDSIWNFEHLEKRPTSAREQQIVDKIVGVVTSKYESVEDAFTNLDLDDNGMLDRTEVSGLLKLAKLSRIVSMVALGRLIDRYDVSNDDSIQWPEFNFAITKAIDKAEKLAKQTTANHQR